MFALSPFDFVKYKDGKRFERNLYIYVEKTKVLISCTASLFSDMQKECFLLTRLIFNCLLNTHLIKPNQ